MPRQSAKSQISEPEAFSQRLTAALVAADIVVSATVVQREFNLLSPQAPVSVHAARKWIMGESIPVMTQRNLHTSSLKYNTLIGCFHAQCLMRSLAGWYYRQ